jgi:hypothetical protein
VRPSVAGLNSLAEMLHRAKYLHRECRSILNNLDYGSGPSGRADSKRDLKLKWLVSRLRLEKLVMKDSGLENIKPERKRCVVGLVCVEHGMDEGHDSCKQRSSVAIRKRA